MDVEIKQVKTKKDKKEFIYLPARVHKGNPDWLPPIYSDEWQLFDEKKNKSYQYADTILYLAYKNGKVAGRIMGIINRRYNAIHNEQHGRFCFLECYEDQEIVHALIKKVEDWAREKGMGKIVGPLAFSDKDPQGFQIEGFEYPQFIVCPTNDSYLPEMIEKEGYDKNRDLVNYLARCPADIPEVYKHILSRVSQKQEYRIIEFQNKKELRQFLLPMLELLNDIFKEIYGFVPLTEPERKELVSRYIMVLDPRFIKAVEHNGELIGFAGGIPDISEGVKRAGGKLFPFGFIHILRASRQSKKLLMLLGGVKSEFRGKGIDVLMGIKILQSCIENRMEWIDLHLVLEDNYKMRAECERINGKIIKRFRIYQKDL
jgi:hypothetical protein